ncbi:CAP domain-containing protein [Rubinisphaera italica]|uniref:Cysteine-rich secretory protein family protein n=1 Tax=Rubinisphaera italica TaxID=2527969 RepID=A0A5C5XED7_9PLAN|nr:CAP domain-containing protein [Rubinisphaera italica]TWT61370.1 Cysteine-rich secretory protein family protein [Rubinisphaera italica]
MMNLLIKLGLLVMTWILGLVASLDTLLHNQIAPTREIYRQVSVPYREVIQKFETEQSSQVEFRQAVNLTAREQLLLELINRARHNPTAEAKRYGIDLNADLEENAISTSPKQPIAPNQLLTNASRAHSEDMLANDYFAHESPEGTHPGDRATAAGYEWNHVGENISWGGSTGEIKEDEQVPERHERLFLSAGHRKNLLKDEFREVGIGFLFGRYKHDDKVTYNASMVTELFGANLRTGHFITGVVYFDASDGSIEDDDFYSIGEGVNGGEVVAVNIETEVEFPGEINAVGGYGVEVPEGAYRITVNGSGLGSETYESDQVTVQSANVKVDFEITTARSISSKSE